MMKQIKRFALSLILIILFQVFSHDQMAYATHAAGSDLTYQSLGGNQYRVVVSFYRDCAGIDEPDNVTVYYRSQTCGYDLNVTAIKIPNTGEEITVPCSSSASTCNGGLTTGIRKFVYEAIVNLPGNCSDWTFSYSICCRNCSITTIQSPCGNNSNLYVEAKLNNLLAPGNSSPSFSNNPIAFVCVGQNFNFNQGVYDADGDSLSYSLITPKTGPSSNVSFISPATVTNPIASSTPFIMDPVTGDINFTPSQIQIGVLAVLVKEYRNGQLIGSVIRDMQVYTTACNNNLPVASGINGSSNYSLTVCPGQQICFNILSNDADPNQVVTMTTNNGIAGAAFSISSGNHPTGTFCWTPGFNDVDLLPKTFTVTVRDDNCPTNGIQTFSYNIYVPSPFFTVTTNAVTCHNGSDGSAIATPVYGSVYNYVWNTNPVQTTQTASNLAAGTYQVTVSDTNQCSLTLPVTISQPNQINIAGNVINASCNGSCNGSISLNVSGGSPSYSYQWSNGTTTSDLHNVCSGIYTVTVTDTHGCSAQNTFSVNSGNGFIASVNSTDVSCHGANDGVADVTIAGGIQPIQYIWSDGETTEDIFGLSAGSYQVTITDGSGCTINLSTSISEPDQIVVIGTASNTACFGSTDGLIDISVSGGTGIYDFTWSNGATSEDVSGLNAGTYSVTVNDMYGCVGSGNFIVSQPDILSTTVVSNDVTCYGLNDGTTQITTTGGTGNYTYQWSNGLNGSTYTNLTAGNYLVTITDDHQCEIIDAISIEQPDSLILSFTTTDATCNGNNGSATALVSGGTVAYTYNWSNGNSTEILSGVAAGSYTLTVTDDHFCQTFGTVAINGVSSSINLAFTSVSSNCALSTDGSADVTVTGGTEPYSYLWSDGSIAEDLLLVAGGNYTLTVTDANGCQQTGQVLIDSPAPINAQIISSNINCNLIKGAIDLEVSGGTPGYTYLWSTGDTSQDINNLDPGVFTVTITDMNGCTASVNETIIEVPELVLIAETGDVSAPGNSDGAVDLTVSGGAAPYLYEWSNGANTEDLTGLSAGVYTVTVTDAAGCSDQLSVNINEPVSTGIASIENEISVLPYNNGSEIILEIHVAEKNNYQVEMYDYAGRLVKELFSGIINSGTNLKLSLQNSEVSKGIYLLRIYSDSSAKVIKVPIQN